MSDDQNTPQNPIPEENPSPVSPESSMQGAPIPTSESTPTEVPSRTPEVPRNSDNAVPVNN